MGGIIGSETLKADEAAYTAMLADNGSTVINRLIAEGKLVNDEGIYHAA
jgi:polyhydroxyalkanoate synthesis regulator phasin